MKTKIITLLLFFLNLQAFCQNKKLLVRDVTIIPLHINNTFEHKDVIIDNGVIIEIRNHLVKDTVSYDLGVIDGVGKYLIPSFADAHSHLPEKENLNTYFLMNLINGVTTLRSMRGEMWHLDINKNDEFTPNLILSSPPVSWRDSISMISANKLISKNKELGFDFLKILSVKNYQTFEYLVEAAKSNNFHLAGHCPSSAGVFKVCQSGVYQSIEHLGGFFRLKNSTEIDSAINLSIINNVYQCPTLDWYFTGQIPENELRQREGVEFLPTQLIEKWEDKISSYYQKTTERERGADRAKSKNKFNNRLNYLNYIYKQGGKLLLSPDASGIYSIPGFGIHTEMKHFANAGISNFDILKAACFNLSEMLQLQNEWGTIKNGTKSDLILLNSNPLESIENTKDINGIIFNGKFYLKSTLEKLLVSGKQ